MKKELLEEYTRICKLLPAHNLKVLEVNDISYGFQISIADNENQIKVNVYHSNKKGFSHIVTGKKKNSLYSQVKKIFHSTESDILPFHNWDNWIGTDESGKGDFFGPLVVAGFVTKKVMIPYLKDLGIMDSKQLDEKEIRRIYRELEKKYKFFMEVLILKPVKYNELYAKFREQNKKLNELLAWMHARVIVNTAKRIKFEGALIDQFAPKSIFKKSLKELQKLEIITKVRGESDISVAAASIISRYHFLEEMNILSQKTGIELKRGAGKMTIESAKIFVNKYGKDKLYKVAKTHFVTMNKL